MSTFKYDFINLKEVGGSFRRPNFANWIKQIDSVLDWVDTQDVSALHDFFFSESERPLVIFGAGGSYSACHYAAYLCNQFGIVALARTPMIVHAMPEDLIRKCRFLVISAHGKSTDINSTAEYLLNIVPDSVAALTAYGIKQEKNRMGKMVVKNQLCLMMMDKYKSSHPFVFDSGISKDGFVGGRLHVALHALLYRAFYPEEGSLAERIFHPDEFAYESNISREQLKSMTDFNLVHGGCGEASAFDLESRLSEDGLGFSMVTDLKNFTHGRHCYIDKHPNTAIVVFETPRDKAFAEKILSCYPPGTPIIRFVSNLPDPLAEVELLIKTMYFTLDFGLLMHIDPSKPKSPTYSSDLHGLDYIDYGY